MRHITSRQLCVRVALAACCLLLLPVRSFAGSPVWHISKQDQSIYLAGTIHLLSAEDYPLPPAFEKAYAASEVVVLETDAAELESAEFQQRLLRRLSYPQGENLGQHISPATSRALGDFFRERGMPFAPLMNFRPGMLTIIMTIEELKRLGVDSIGVDEHFAKRARADGKQLQQLESADVQLGFLAALGAGREEDVMVYQLEEMHRLPNLWQAMIGAWRSGDMVALESSSMAEMRDKFPGIYDLLIKQRNQNWMPEIEALFDTEQIEMVLVGSLHLAGDNGLLAMLAESGYQIRQLP